ncbi:MAG: FlgD immunoglobulin-like domain containing protein, partial [Candidatus Kapaibacterium sp.]
FNVTDQYVVSDYQQWGDPTPQQVRSDFATYPVEPPLAFNASLITSATNHSKEMLLVDSMYHVGPDGDPLTRMKNAGYMPTGYTGENCGAYDRDLEEDHDGFQIDFGNPGLGHRMNIMNFDPTGPFYREIGIGIIHGGAGWPDVGPIITTEDFGDAGKTFILGVAYTDNNHNHFYDIGEGDSGVKITVSGGSYYAVTSGSGGYAIPFSGSGSVTVTASGGPFPTPVTKTIDFNGENVKVDFNPDLTGYPTQASLVFPVADTTVNSDSVAFTWNSVALAKNYHIEIGTDSLLKKTLLKNDSVLTAPDTVFKYGIFKDSTTYYWRVQAKNAKGLGPWSAIAAFTVGLPPSPIVLISPSNAATVGDSDVTFLWRMANKGVQSYAIVVSSKKTMTDTIWSDMLYIPNDTTDVGPASNFQAGQTYYWTVSGYNDFGWGRPSAPNSFNFASSSVAPSNISTDAISISPNPAMGLARIYFSLATAQDVSLRLFNSVGEEVKSIALGTRPAGPNEYDFDGSSLAAGTYSFELRVGSRIQGGRIVLIK